jgi:polar amino acid transport system permease protein
LVVVLGDLCDHLRTTARLFGLRDDPVPAIVGAFFIGLVLGAARAHRIPVVSQLAAIYVEVIRNTPILVQIFFLYFGLGSLGVTELFGTGVTVDLRLDAFTVAWLSVMIWGGAFNTENFRAGSKLSRPATARRASLGFGRPRRSSTSLADRRAIALPFSINTCISASRTRRCTSSATWSDDGRAQINALTLQMAEIFTVLAITFSPPSGDVRGDPVRRSAAGTPEER